MKARWWSLAFASCSLAAAATPAFAQIDGPTQPVVQRPLSPVGETEVRYFNDGVLTSETRIPGDSLFNTSGAGSGGAGVVQPCYTFTWSQVEPNPHPRINRRTGRPRNPEIRVDYS